jgi:hypothetical protein
MQIKMYHQSNILNHVVKDEKSSVCYITVWFACFCSNAAGETKRDESENRKLNEYYFTI